MRRFCAKCREELLYADFRESNPSLKKIEKIWKDGRVALLCCRCRDYMLNCEDKPLNKIGNRAWEKCPICNSGILRFRRDIYYCNQCDIILGKGDLLDIVGYQNRKLEEWCEF